MVKEITEWVLSIIIAVALALAVNNYVGQIIGVDGPSMEPNLYTNERMLVTRYTYYFKEPERGDIVIVHFPDDRANYVKRVIGLPGETLSASGGHVYVDGEMLYEPYLGEDVIIYDMPGTLVPDGYVFVMGDNRGDSRDSRSPTVGPIKREDVVGKVQAVVFPFDRLSWVSHSGAVLMPGTIN